VGGAEDYAVRLLSAIPAGGPVRLTVFAPRGFSERHPPLSERHEVVAPPAGKSRLLRVLVENTWLARQCRRRRLDVVHHFGGTIPLVGMRPALVTIHDVQPLDHPKRFGLVKRLYLRAMLPWAARRAEAVVTVSEFCRRRIADRLGVGPDRVAVVPAPVDAGAGAQEKPLAAAAPDLSQPFVLYPAVAHPHKNHEVLLRALARLAAEGEDVVLVATGARGPLDADLDGLAEELGVGNRWHRLGRMNRPVLDGLMRLATAVVFPSRYEGYGLPVVEAMARGCPVVAADAGALSEVVGSGGLLVAPDDDAGWADAIAVLLRGDERRETLVEAGAARVAELAELDPAAELCALYARTAR